MVASPGFESKKGWFIDGLFILVLATIAVFKFNDLSLPYFWDELGVYAQAAVYQYHHGISLMPSAVPELISRGHPLMYTFLNASVLKIAGGTNVFYAHAFNLCIALALLIVLYLKTSKYFGKPTALVTIVVLAAQPVFLAQASLVIPEMLLALFVLLSLFAWYEEKYWQFSIWASAALLTKETAVLLPATVVLYTIIRVVFLKDNSYRFRPLQLLSAFVPYAIFIVFLLFQKQQYGWYFFPYHIDLIAQSFIQLKEHFKMCVLFVFNAQARFLWSIILVAGSAYFLYTKKIPQRNLLLLLAIFIALAFCFNIVNVFMERYMIIEIIPLSIFVAVGLFSLFRNKFIIALSTIILVWGGLNFLQTSFFNYDYDLGYRKDVRVIQQAVDYAVEISGNEHYVFANFPVYFAILFPEGGYLKGREIKAKTELDDSVEYLILSSPGTSLGDATDKYNMTLLREFKEGYAVTRVYSLKRK